MGRVNINTMSSSEVASASKSGLMSASDKSKLDSIAEGADAVSFSRSLTSGTKIGTLTINGLSTDLYCNNGTNTTYGVATTSSNGLMSSSDKSKLDAITASADSVSFSRSLTSGTKIGTITINGTATDLYCNSYGVVTTSANGLMAYTDKSKLNYTNIAYGTCSTAAATAAKVVTISGNANWTLTVGSIITVKFANSNTASNVTLNVNNTGAKSIWYNTMIYGGNNSAYTGYKNRPIMYMYDGTYWVFIGHSAEYTYTGASATASGLVTTGTQEFAGAKVFQDYIYQKHPNYTKGSTAPSSLQFKAHRFLDSANKILGEFSNMVDTNNCTIAKMTATATACLDNSVYSQIATVINADGSYLSHVCTAPAIGASSLRQMASGTAAVSTTNCPSGAWYGHHK